MVPPCVQAPPGPTHSCHNVTDCAPWAHRNHTLYSVPPPPTWQPSVCSPWRQVCFRFVCLFCSSYFSILSSLFKVFQTPPFPPLMPLKPLSPLQAFARYCLCPGLCVWHTWSLVDPPPQDPQSVPCSHVSGSILLASLFCSLGSTRVRPCCVGFRTGVLGNVTHTRKDAVTSEGKPAQPRF